MGMPASVRTCVLRGVPCALLLLAAALPAAAQQFSIVRNFDHIRRSSDGRPLQNIYWVSLPLVPVIADGANTAAPSFNKCVGDPDGPAFGDGIINSDDVICAWWTARTNPATAGAFTLSRIFPEVCTPVGRSAFAFQGAIRFSGMTFPIEPGAGLQVLITAPAAATYSPRNRAVLAGDHDDAWPGRAITYAAGCAATAPRTDLIAVPYHAIYSSVDEILCGLEGVDWVDANADGKPDTCWDDRNGNGVRDAGEGATGIFDGRRLILVSRFDNTEAVNTTQTRMVTVALGRLFFIGQRFPLTVGEACVVQLSPGHQPTLFLPPHR